VGTVGKGVLERAFENGVKAIEARNGVASEEVHEPRSSVCGVRQERLSGVSSADDG
jgi:hypothetical protein